MSTMPQSQELRVILSYLITAMLAVVMVGMGCAVDLKVVKKHLKRPTGIIVGFLCQFGKLLLANRKCQLKCGQGRNHVFAQLPKVMMALVQIL